jgi:DNA-directed RNA polymerase subunit RPC12/RpoP
MLSKTSRQEILKRISTKIGFAVVEVNLTPATRQAITNLATLQRHLYVITELLEGENSRIERSALLRLASRIGKDSEKEERTRLAEEIGKLQAEVDVKISELSDRILKEENARQAGQPPPEFANNIGVAQLKCPTCGASLPLPTGRFIKCQYCNAVLSIQEVTSQMKSMIQNI